MINKPWFFVIEWAGGASLCSRKASSANLCLNTATHLRLYRHPLKDEEPKSFSAQFKVKLTERLGQSMFDENLA